MNNEVYKNWIIQAKRYYKLAEKVKFEYVDISYFLLKHSIEMFIKAKIIEVKGLQESREFKTHHLIELINYYSDVFKVLGEDRYNLLKDFVKEFEKEDFNVFNEEADVEFEEENSCQAAMVAHLKYPRRKWVPYKDIRIEDYNNKYEIALKILDILKLKGGDDGITPYI